MKAIFIAGTDTGVGKTAVTGLLARYLSEKGYKVVTQKWVATGKVNDCDAHDKYMGRYTRNLKGFDSLRMPFRFKFPSSPHLAGALEAKRVDKARIKESLDILSKSFNFVIVEGTGGLLVPLNNRDLLIDLVDELDLPVLLVAANRVGVINHTLLSIEALKKRRMNIIGIIFNDIYKDIKKIILEDNPEVVRKFGKVPVLGRLPGEHNVRKLQQQFDRLGNKILAGL